MLPFYPVYTRCITARRLRLRYSLGMPATGGLFFVGRLTC
jgi:hypothetical protein